MYVHLSIPQMIKGLSGNLIEWRNGCRGLSDCEELVGGNHRRWRGWYSPKIQYKSAQIVYSRTTRARGK